MLNIFVLEDDFFQQTRIETAIKKCMADNNLKYRYLEVFGKPQQLLEAIKETGNHQFFFLDIEIKGEEKKVWRLHVKFVKRIRVLQLYL
ncbi:RevS [Streptococcus acidominimus]|uniref:RevS n=1 Tax=Streptococcus acidominimus TaxID=1326 RepID=A0A239XLZ1_STRAI|nr:RevS [Streptococcus acidominimus]